MIYKITIETGIELVIASQEKCFHLLPQEILGILVDSEACLCHQQSGTNWHTFFPHTHSSYDRLASLVPRLRPGSRL